jgi:acyl-[acyl-carrier-protein]--UDP-N-acetylglucosamine O-acyltransferase
MSRIHPTAIIEGEVEIGEDVEIGPYTYISGKVKIGRGTRIGPYCVIVGKVFIGEGNRIHHNASIGQPPQDVNYKGEESEVIIGNNNTIREFVTIHRATGEGKATIIGDNNFLMAYVHIAHNCKLGNGITIANLAQLAGYVEVEDQAFISGVLGIHQWCRVGAYAMVGGMTRLNQDAPPYFITAGYEPEVLGLNFVGLRRRGFSQERMEILKEAYKTIYRSNLNLEDALKLLEDKFPESEDIKHLVRFYRGSRRGVVMRGGNSTLS